MRTALTSVDGIADIKTNPADNTCSFKAPADLDVKATLNKLAEDGNKHIKDWALDDAKKEEKKENKPKPNGDAQTVSLKLPNMTWGGCARSVRTALTSVDGIADIKTNPSDNTCSFKAPADLDVKATLNKLAEGGNKHIKDWALDGSDK